MKKPTRRLLDVKVSRIRSQFAEGLLASARATRNLQKLREREAELTGLAFGEYTGSSSSRIPPPVDENDYLAELLEALEQEGSEEE